ncbi:MAG: hypothetical protein EOO89_09705 [Pedobacter sp.]|nr:MAG: hypothetical protein EOO89_09705 [Pedobacter sp.]
MAQTKDWQILRRQPKAAIWLLVLSSAVKTLKAFWPIILVAFFKSANKGGDRYHLYLFILPALIPVIAVIDFLTFSYCIQNGQLMIKKGWLVKKDLNIPLQNIQSVNIEQSWLHKLVNLVKLSIDSPGTEKSEVQISLTRQDAETLKEFVLQHQGKASEAISRQDSVITTLSASDLFKLGLSANHLETLAIMMGLALSMLENVRGFFDSEYGDMLKKSAKSLVAESMLFILYIIVGVLLLSVVVSFFRIIFKYANFTILSTEKGFNVRSGLINSTERLIAFKKIQYVSWKANWIRKKLPIFLLEYHSIGGEEIKQKLKITIPVVSTTLRHYLEDIYGKGVPKEDPSLRISRKIIFRRTLIGGILPFLVLAGSLYPVIGFKSLLFFMLPVLVYWNSRLVQRKFRIYMNEKLIHIRKGAFGDAEIILKWYKIQSVELVRSYYQRRNDLASIKIHTAGGSITLPFLEIEEARSLFNYTLYKIESNDEQTWTSS